MAWNLDAPPESGSVLTMPVGFNFMNADILGPSLFIRTCYLPILRKIFDDFLLPSSFRRIIVQGVPGIGKTCFLYYLLCDLIRKRKTVVFEDFTGLMFMVTSEGDIYEGTRNAHVFKAPLNDIDSYYLFNCGGKPGIAVPSVVSALSIVASSPCADHTKEFVKAGSCSLYYMPMWELDELERCRVKCNSKLTAELVTERYSLWGGVARRCFYRGDEALLAADMTNELSKYEADPNSIFSKVGGLNLLEISHCLLHYSVSENFKNFTMILASDKVADRLCDLNFEAVVDQIARLQTKREDSGLRGKLFERFGLRFVPLGCKADEPMSKKTPSKKRGKIISETLPKAFIPSIKDIPATPYNTYLIFSHHNAPSIDAAVKHEGGSIIG